MKNVIPILHKNLGLLKNIFIWKQKQYVQINNSLFKEVPLFLFCRVFFPS